MENKELEREVTEDIDSLLFKMTENCSKLKRCIGNRETDTVMDLMQEIGIIYDKIGEEAFVLCDISQDDINNHFIENDEDMLKTLAADTTSLKK